MGAVDAGKAVDGNGSWFDMVELLQEREREKARLPSCSVTRAPDKWK